MKSFSRVVYAFTALTVVVGLSACGSSSSSTAPVASASPSASPSSDLPAGTIVRVGAVNDPPFMFRDAQGSWASLAAEMARQFGEYEHVKIEFVDTSWPTIIAGLQTKKYDVIQPSLNATPERKAVVDFTDAVSAAGALYFIKPGSPYKTMADLNNPSVTIATITGSAEEQVTKTLLPKAHLRSLPTASVSDLATEVISGRSNVMVDSSYLAPAIKGAFSLDSLPDYASNPDGLEAVSIGFAVRKGDTVLLNALNKFIGEMKASGKLQALKDQWLTVQNALKG
jgi:polar amino acid transport system substrate-binding protein